MIDAPASIGAAGVGGLALGFTLDPVDILAELRREVVVSDGHLRLGLAGDE